MTVEIILQDPTSVHLVGDKIKGKVLFTTRKKHRIGKVLKIKFVCTEVLKHAKTEALSYQKIIFERELVLCGQDQENSRVTATDGMEFPFEFQVPYEDPELHYRGSLLARIGAVTVFSVYSVKALFALLDTDKEFDYDEAIVNVKPRFEYSDPALQKLEHVDQKIPLIQGDSDLLFRCNSLKAGYKPDELINFTFSISNHSNKIIERIKICLKRTIHYLTPSGKWTRESEVLKNSLIFSSVNIKPGVKNHSVTLNIPFAGIQPTIYGFNFVHSYEVETVFQYRNSTIEVVFYSSFLGIPSSHEYFTTLQQFAERGRLMKSVREEFDQLRKVLPKINA